MKRKIAILLSAMMVTSAMPLSANAATLEPDKVQNITFGKVNEPIDDRVGKNLDASGKPTVTIPSGAKDDVRYENLSDLQRRRSVIKIDLKDDGTDNIDSNVRSNSFRIELENGEFNEGLLENGYYKYINVAPSGQNVYFKDLRASDGVTSLNDPNVSSIPLGEAFKQIINAGVNQSNKDKIGDIEVVRKGEKITDAGVEARVKYATGATATATNNTNLETLLALFPNGVGTGTTSIPVNIKENNPDLFMGALNEVTNGQFKKDLDSVLNDIYKLYSEGYINASGNLDTNILPHIPYEISVDSPTTATITVPNITLTNSDKKDGVRVNLNTVLKDKVKVRFYTSVGSTYPNGINPTGGVLDFDVTGKSVEITSNGAVDYTKITDLNQITGIAFDLDFDDAESTTEKVVKDPFIALPLGAVVATSNGVVKAKVISNYTDKVNYEKEYSLTNEIKDGDTNLIYDEKNARGFEDFTQLAPVVVKENTRYTIGRLKDTAYTDYTNNGVTYDANKDVVELTLRLNGGFKFKTNGTNKVVFKNDRTGQILTPITDYEYELNRDNYYNRASRDNYYKQEQSNTSGVFFSPDQSVIKVKLKGLNGTSGQATNNRELPTGIRIEGLYVEAIDEKTFGDVSLTVSGDGITTGTKTVARRNKFGFELKTLKDPQEIISGRHYKADVKNMNEAANTTVEVKFSEAVPNTLVESRALDFSVPEGVKIVGATIDKYGNFAKNPTNDSFEIINEGKTLRLKRNSGDFKNPGKGDYFVREDANKNLNVLANFTLKLDLSVDPGFSGDIKLGVTGGGQSETVETVIAKAVIPFEIKSKTTNINLGYQDYDTSDIVVTEARPGMFLANEYAYLSISAPYGTQELGFSKAEYDISGGELEVKPKDFEIVKGDNNNNNNTGVIRFRINRSSYKSPSTITIKNVKVGTTRSVPYGAYDLNLSGRAIINNYTKPVDDNRTFTSITAKPSELYMQDNTSAYAFKDYINLTTETGTFDKTVKVSVGAKTVLVGDQAIDMDVAPYIQASSNSTMVPLRFVSVALGVDSSNLANADASNKVIWDQNSKTATIYYGSGTGQKIIQFQANSNIMTVDGTRIPMEFGVKAEIKDGRMFVPFRALGQALGISVEWDADTRTAIYNRENARNVSNTPATTTQSTTAANSDSTTQSTTATNSDSTTQSTTAANSDSTTQTTTAKQ